MKIIGTIPKRYVSDSYMVEISPEELVRLTGRAINTLKPGDEVHVSEIYRKVFKLGQAKEEFDRVKTVLSGIQEMLNPLEQIVVEALKDDKEAENLETT